MNLAQRLWNAIRNKPTSGIRASSTGYDAGSSGRRNTGWQASRLGPNTLLWSNLEQLRARSRDAVRNSAIARAAIDRWESNVIGTGITPHFLHTNPAIRNILQTSWNRWVKKSDHAGQLNFYGQQALLVREVFEAGECFVRFHVRPQSDRLFIPLQLQLLESEQCPIFRNVIAGGDTNSVRAGIVFDSNDRRVGYDLYRGQPYDSLFDPQASSQFIFLPAIDMLHVMKPLRAGALRGEPQMTAVLALLYEIESYADAERVRKKVASMFAAFVTKLNPDDVVLPSDPNNQGLTQDAGTEIGKLEPGTIQALMPGENITFPTLPEASDYGAFMYTELHRFASACGLTYEQLTGDLRGVNYSSIRAGLLEFRRACEQYQENIIIQGFCEPVKDRWLREAVLCGAVELPDDYFEDPTPYEACVWVAPGWQWVSPKDEVEAYQTAVRSGFTSRTQVLRELGLDPEIVDNQQADERKRAASLNIIYDSDPNKVLIGRETLQPDRVVPKTDQDTEESEGE